MARHLALLGLSAGALLLAGCGTSAATAQAPKAAPAHTLTLQLSVNGDFDNWAGCGRTGKGGYADMTNGTDVTVYDGNSHVIATTTLGDTCHTGPGGSPTAVPQWDVFWTTPVPNVPDATFYQVEVGHRGKVTSSRADMATKNWTVSLNLGGAS